MRRCGHLVIRHGRGCLSKIDKLMRKHPEVLQQNVRLMRLLSIGDAEGSATAARDLAVMIHDRSSSKHPVDFPPVSGDNVSAVLEKIPEPEPLATEMLFVALIDCSFEGPVEVPGELLNKTLDSFMQSEKLRWKERRHLLGARVLDCAKLVGVTPKNLWTSFRDDPAAHNNEKEFNPLQHCNVVVVCRPELMGDTSTVASIIEQQLSELRSSRAEWTDDVALLSRQELVLQHSRVQYDVGLHHSLTSAVGADVSSRLSGKIVSVLNGDAALRSPILPFTAFLKMCLWHRLP